MGLTRKQEEAHQRASNLIFGSDKPIQPDEEGEPLLLIRLDDIN